MAVVENMSYFDGHDGRRYTPFGAGSGDRIQREFGLPHIVRFPIAEDISSAGDGGAFSSTFFLPASRDGRPPCKLLHCYGIMR